MSKIVPIKILIADDDQDDLEYMSFLFEQHQGFELVASLHNGKEVIDFLSAAAALPDIVVVDMYMPLMNGAEVVANLMASDLGQKMSIFVISSIPNEVLKENFANVDTIEFLRKPGNLEEVNDLPEVILERLNMQNINRI